MANKKRNIINKNNILKKIQYGKHSINKDDISEVTNALKNNHITQGPLIKKFEERLLKVMNSKYCVALSSGTAALHLAIKSLELNKGSEIITTPMTFCATVNSILYNDHKVKLVDIDKNTLNIDPNKIEKKITKKTEAILGVDFRGHPADWPSLKKIANHYKIKLIQDASHSLGSKYYYNKKIYTCGDGIHSDLSTFSFHPVKHITTGEGGAISTNNRKIYKKLKNLLKHGIDRNAKMYNKNKRVGEWYYDMFDLGFNYRLTDFQSALGISQLNKFEYFKKRRKEIVNIYNIQLKELPYLKLPYQEKKVYPNFHIYTLQVIKNKLFDRYDLFNFLRDNNIFTMVHYIPIHFLDYYKKITNYKKGDFPNAENYYNSTLSLPLFPSLTNKEQNYVIDLLKKFIKNKIKKN